MKKQFFLLAFLFAIAFTYGQTTCQYLAYESFDAPANSPLQGASSGSGWAGAWTVQGGSTVVPGYNIQANSLSYNNLQTVGMSATGGYIYVTAGRRLNTNDGGPFDDYVAAYQNAIGTETGTELWVSGLVRKDMNNMEPIFMAFHDNGIDWCEPCSSNKLEFGYFGADSDVNGVKMWSIKLGTTVYPTTIPLIVGTSAFFAAKISFTPTGTSVDCYVNPATLGNSMPSSPTLSQSSTTNLLIRSFATYLGNSPGNGSIDEMRMATSYACVAPDNTVLVDLPPLASFTLSANSGTSPVTVQLDGTASSDPENTALTYSWNFGDGTPIVTGQPTANHTFTPLGVLNVALTVTDAGGQSHTTYRPLTVYDASGTYPCNSTFTLTHEASCGQSDGSLRINGAPATFSLVNSSNVAMTLSGQNQFLNLAAGSYTYTCDGGVGGCKDTFQLNIPTDSSTCAGWQPSDCAMDIGVNLSGIADWAYERPFRNLFLHVRQDPVVFHQGCNCWDDGMLSEIQMDSNGYPLQIPQVTSASPNTYVRMVMSSNNANLQQGNTYVLLYDGIGDIQIHGDAMEVSDTLNRIEFDVMGTGNIWFDLMASQAGKYVRNIRILRLADEFATDLETQPFYSEFLNKISSFNSLRFMDWGATNASPHVQWQNRAKVSQKTYAGEKGVPYERMIQLANIAHKNVWVCVPHAADDNYITKMAQLFRDSLNPSLTVYLEYSNEVWNWMFLQAHYNDQTKPSNLSYGEAYSEKAKHVFQIWHDVFSIRKNQVKRVLGLQGGYNSLNELILSQIKQSEWDYASPTFYYGLDHGNTGNPVLNASSTPLDVLQNSANAFHDFAPYIHQDYRNTHLFGKPVINYEGGQHFTNFTQPPYLQAMYDAQVLPQMYNLYDNVLDSIRLWGSKMAMAFTLASAKESIYGSWGHLEDIDQDTAAQPTPKYRALMNNMAHTPVPVIGGNIVSGNNLVNSNFYVQNPIGTGYNYQWSVSSGGSIIGNPNSSQIEVAWSVINTMDTGFVSLTIIDNNGCSATTTINLPIYLYMGIDDNTDNFFSIYPNPAEDNFFIVQKMPIPSQENAYLFNTMGQLVKTISLTGEKTNVEVKDLTSGVYVLRIGNVSKRIVVED
jgi:hypothetical protein